VTEQLYYKNPYRYEFNAEVIELNKLQNKWQVLLDKTFFYPEGGGQPADKGWINNIPVVDVQKQEKFIYHILEKNPGEGTVVGRIDKEWRQDFMQQHSGQHIISGALWKIGKYKTLSVHMGIDYTTIEIDSPVLPEQDLLSVENLANQIICDNIPLSFIETNQQNINRYLLRKPTNHKGKIRLVQIGEFDCVGCGGLHLERTGLVRLIKAIGNEKIRDHVRIAWKIGNRALADYRKKTEITSFMKQLLATNEDLYVQKIKDLLHELSTLKKKYSQQEGKLADAMASQLLDEAEIDSGNGIKIVTTILNGEDDILIKKILKILLKHPRTITCLTNINPGRLQWSIGSSQDINFPFDEHKNDLLHTIDGKGGGRWPLWQGIGLKLQGVEEFFSKFKDLTAML